MIMRQHTITAALIAVVFLGASCTDNFDKLNRKAYQVDNEELQREGYIIGSTLKGMQGLVVPTQEHLYQFIEALAAGPFAGYFGATVAWTDKFETYNPPVDWQNKTFSDVFTRTYPFYRDILSFTDDPVAVALAKLLRVAIMHRMTDMYGPIPYSKVLSGSSDESLAVAYDSQEEVYRQMLKELDEVSAALSENLGLGAEAFRKYDDVYFGDLSKWYRFTHSLKLRMAMRMVYADEAAARKAAEEAVAAGVIAANSDNAFLTVAENRSAMVFNDWSDHRVGADIISYMNGYSDPRREKMFTKGLHNKKEDFYGIRIGIDVANKDLVTGVYSSPLVTEASPFLWMNAAEVTFLRAEGALRGWDMGGDAKTLYNTAIALSFEQHGVSGAEEYSADAKKIPAAYTDPRGEWSDKSGPRSRITVAWEEGDAAFERNLERIITQKWIAIFPLCVEAWSEFRRTGYPKLIPVAENKSGGTIDSGVMIRRLWYPPLEYSENPKNLAAAVASLGGPDNGGTRLWWDKKP